MKEVKHCQIEKRENNHVILPFIFTKDSEASGRPDVLLYLSPLNYGEELNLATWSVLFFFVNCFLSIIITDSDPLSHLLIFSFFRFAETVLRFQK